MSDTPEPVTKPTGGRERSLANLKPFVKGQSGNPSGLPKSVAGLMGKAKDHGDDALNVIIKLLKSKDDKVKLAAAERILDRGYGKPKQSVEVGSTKRSLDELTTDELMHELLTRRNSDGASEAEEGDPESN